MSSDFSRRPLVSAAAVSGIKKASATRIRIMAPSPERTALYERMRDMTIEDAAYAGSMCRERFYLLARKPG